jgi:hypothetical protein
MKAFVTQTTNIEKSGLALHGWRPTAVNVKADATWADHPSLVHSESGDIACRHDGSTYNTTA